MSGSRELDGDEEMCAAALRSLVGAAADFKVRVDLVDGVNKYTVVDTIQNRADTDLPS